MNHSTHRHFFGCFNLASLCTNLKWLTQITVLCNSYVNKIIVLWGCCFIYSHSAGVNHKATTAKLPFICLAVCHRVRSQSLTLSGPVVKDSRDLRIILVSVTDLHYEFEQQASPLWARCPPLFSPPLFVCPVYQVNTSKRVLVWCPGSVSLSISSMYGCNNTANSFYDSLCMDFSEVAAVM